MENAAHWGYEGGRENNNPPMYRAYGYTQPFLPIKLFPQSELQIHSMAPKLRTGDKDAYDKGGKGGYDTDGYDKHGDVPSSSKSGRFPRKARWPAGSMARLKLVGRRPKVVPRQPRRPSSPPSPRHFYRQGLDIPDILYRKGLARRGESCSMACERHMERERDRVLERLLHKAVVERGWRTPAIVGEPPPTATIRLLPNIEDMDVDDMSPLEEAEHSSDDDDVTEYAEHCTCGG